MAVFSEKLNAKCEENDQINTIKYTVDKQTRIAHILIIIVEQVIEQ